MLQSPSRWLATNNKPSNYRRRVNGGTSAAQKMPLLHRRRNLFPKPNCCGGPLSNGGRRAAGSEPHHHWNEDPMCGCRIGTSVPILHANKGQLCLIGFGDAWLPWPSRLVWRRLEEHSAQALLSGTACSDWRLLAAGARVEAFVRGLKTSCPHASVLLRGIQPFSAFVNGSFYSFKHPSAFTQASEAHRAPFKRSVPSALCALCALAWHKRVADMALALYHPPGSPKPQGLTVVASAMSTVVPAGRLPLPHCPAISSCPCVLLRARHRWNRILSVAANAGPNVLSCVPN
jgi:hypothetical protein